MRLISECPDFDWKNPLVCYLYIENGTVRQVGKDIQPQVAYANASNKRGKLVAVWPGKWRTDAFIIDKLKGYGLAFGCCYEPLPVKILGFKHKKSEYDTGVSAYMKFFLQDPTDVVHSSGFLERFSEDIKRRFGWSIAISKGIDTQKRNDRQMVGVYVKPTKKYPLKESWGDADEEYFWRWD